MVWYISLILILYLFFPLLYRMVAIPDRRLRRCIDGRPDGGGHGRLFGAVWLLLCRV